MDAHGGATTLALRKRLAATAFAHTATYDGMIASWFAFADQGKLFPDTLPLTAKLASELRYGENPHQKAALYLPAGPAARGIAQAEQVQRSEEHTSELQSLMRISYAVFCLKKKTSDNNKIKH